MRALSHRSLQRCAPELALACTVVLSRLCVRTGKLIADKKLSLEAAERMCLSMVLRGSRAVLSGEGVEPLRGCARPEGLLESSVRHSSRPTCASSRLACTRLPDSGWNRGHHFNGRIGLFERQLQRVVYQSRQSFA